MKNNHCVNILWLAEENITQTGNPRHFNHTGKVSRGQMAAFTYRLATKAKAQPKCTSAPFKDVSPSHKFCGYIQWMKTQKLTTGSGSSQQYEPASIVSRGAAVAFVYRMHANDAPQPTCSSRPFTDVPVDHKFCGYIAWAKTNSITTGIGGGKFGPSGSVTRGAMASFLQRLAAFSAQQGKPLVNAFDVGSIKAKGYITTQNGETDLWYTKRSSPVVAEHGNYTVPAGTPVWKVKDAGKGRWVVNGGGARNVTMNSADLVRTSPAAKSNTTGISLASFKKQRKGHIPDKYLAQIDFGTHALVGGPAVKDLNRLNVAFKKKFGEDLYVDLGYRTASQQQNLYNEHGPLIAAAPGTSIHEAGLSIDMPEHSRYGWNSARFTWLKQNAPAYGWEHPRRVWLYRDGRLSPYREYWHFDYVG